MIFPIHLSLFNIFGLMSFCSSGQQNDELLFFFAEPEVNSISRTKMKTQFIHSLTDRVKISEMSIPADGEADYRERVDFGKIIGEAVYDENGVTKQSETTMGIIRYDSKRFAHITPAKPKL
jgi:hypothetical protein